MPLKTFTCSACGDFDLVLSRYEYDHEVVALCPTCGMDATPALGSDTPLTARRNPAHGIQS